MGRFGKTIQWAAAALNDLAKVELGEGNQIYSDFSGGYNSSMSREQVPENTSPSMMDMQVSYDGKLKRVPGTSQEEILDHAASRIITHANINLTSELLFFAPPYIGVRTTGPTTVWTDIGMRSDEFAWANFGGTLVFCDGSKVRLRNPRGASQVTTKIPVGKSYATFAGRLWVGNCVIDGTMQPMGVRWSDTTADPESWDTNQGSGFEILVNDLAVGDEVVAMRPMGLDFMAILCRNSVWVGRRTGLEDRPADLQPRVSGVGALTEKLAVLSRFGVYFVTHTGVYVFDGNSATMISEPINHDILPLDLSVLDDYGLYFNPVKKLLYFFTPDGTWLYEVEKNRWFPMSMVAKDATIFATQFTGLTWADLVGTWGQQQVRWMDYSPDESRETKTMLLSPDGEQLASEIEISATAFEIDLNPYWTSPMKQQEWLQRLITTRGVIVEYTGHGRIEIWTPNNKSQLQFATKIDLPDVTVPDVYYKGFVTTGRGLQVQLRIISGSLEILRTQLVYRNRGSRMK